MIGIKANFTKIKQCPYKQTLGCNHEYQNKLQSTVHVGLQQKIEDSKGKV